MGRPTIGKDDESNSTSLGDALNTLFDEMFLTQLPTSTFSVALKSYMHERAPFLVYGEEEMREQQECNMTTYDALLPSLIQDVLDRCKHRCSSLGMEAPGEPYRPGYLAIALSRDGTQRVIPEEEAVSSTLIAPAPVSDLEFALLAQQWSAIHPLSVCVSTDRINGTSPLDQALRSVIASEAMVLLGADTARGKELMEYAHRLFYQARLQKSRRKETLFRACQVSSLLAWYHTSHTRAKKGVSFLALASQLVNQLQNVTSDDEKDAELCSNMSGFCSLMTVWVGAQLDRASGCLLSVGTNSQSNFYANSALMMSVILCSFPEPSTLSEWSSSNQQRQGLSQHFVTILTGVEIEEEGDGKMVTLLAIREMLLLCLLAPRSPPSGPNSDPDALLSRCEVAVPLLQRLTGKEDQQEEDKPVLSRVAYQRSPRQTNGDIAMRATLASTLFETLAEAVDYLARRHAFSSRLSALTQTLLHLHLPHVVETDGIKKARSSLQSNHIAFGLDDTASIQGGIQWEQSFLPPMPDADVTIPMKWDEAAQSDLFSTWWGQLQWDDLSPVSSGESESTTEPG